MSWSVTDRMRYGAVQQEGRFADGQDDYEQIIEDMENIEVTVAERYGPAFTGFRDGVWSDSETVTGLSGSEALDYIDGTLRHMTRDGNGLDDLEVYAEHRHRDGHDHLLLHTSSPLTFGFQNRYRITVDGERPDLSEV